MEEKIVFNFEKLLVYDKALDFVDLIYEMSSRFPQHELFNLSQQMRRAANSVTLNITEGSAGTSREFKLFIRIAFRSLYECVNCSTLARRRGYIDTMLDNRLRRDAMNIARMLSGLRNSLPDNKK